MSATTRGAENEALWRRVNEAIEQGQVPRAADERVAFACECGVLRCSRLVEMTVPEYEAVRANPRRFVLVPGHEDAAAERVVERRDRYVVVEKIGAQGRIAEDTDPRRRR